MHIADGVLSPEVCVVAGGVSVAAVGYSLRKVNADLAEKTVPMTGMMAALIFAGQMVNFPLGVVPVSGHLMGGVLAAVVLGPWAGCLAVTMVLCVQALLFADGGLLALGANVLNMAVVGAIGGYAIYSLVRPRFKEQAAGVIVGSVVAAWVTVLASAALFCLELRLSWVDSQFPWGNIFTLMVAFHSAIGVGEALITGMVLSFLWSQRPGLIATVDVETGRVQQMGRVTVAGLVSALAVAAFLGPFASSHPDGLEAVAERTEFDQLEASLTPLAFADYEIPLTRLGWEGVAGWQKVSVALAGVLGTLAVFVVSFALTRSIRRPVPAVEANHAE